MTVETMLAVLLQASASEDLLSDRALGAIVGVMFLAGVVWLIKRAVGHKPVDQKMSIRLEDDPSERYSNSLPVTRHRINF